MGRSYLFCIQWFLLVLLFSPVLSAQPDFSRGDAVALLALKASLDTTGVLPWSPATDPCIWEGVKECMKGRVTKLVVEHCNLSGALDRRYLNQLDQLRVLSFKGNKISGEIPEMSGLVNLKSLYLNNNGFTGGFPASITGLHRLKIVVLSENRLSGQIPPALANVTRLYVLYLDNNEFTGEIPALNQPSLKLLNFSNNGFSGEIPGTPALAQFNQSSFLNNVDLCGPQIGLPCNNNNTNDNDNDNPVPQRGSRAKPHHKKTKIIAIVASTGALGLLFLGVLLLGLLLRRRRQLGDNNKVREVKLEQAGGGGGGGGGAAVVRERGEGSEYGGGKGGFSWEGERLGKLVFVGGGGEREMSYALEDLLRASAETLGRGTVGSTYKAVMESGYIVTVKRLKDSRYPKTGDFRRSMEELGRLRHPNIVPLRAYFQAKEERLLVYDYFPNGSLFSLIHGTRPSGGGKPLHWTSCLKIAEDLASGLVYLHHHNSAGLVHGNLKSTNVLLGPDFESCLTDYGLHILHNPESPEEPGAASLFYRAPECRSLGKAVLQQSDVYSFGVLLLELLTGKTPFQDLVQQHGSDIPRWVRSVRDEETESGEGSSGNEASEEKLGALINIAMACVSMVPNDRPVMREVLRMIREARAEAQVSSNSSDHSPGRWSDTIQSVPREEHSSI